MDANFSSSVSRHTYTFLGPSLKCLVSKSVIPSAIPPQITSHLICFIFVITVGSSKYIMHNASWFGAMMDIMDRLYGKPRISAEVAHTGGISLNITTDPETKELIEGGLD